MKDKTCATCKFSDHYNGFLYCFCSFCVMHGEKVKKGFSCNLWDNDSRHCTLDKDGKEEATFLAGECRKCM